MPEDLDRAQRAAGRADVFLAIGTSLVVYPAAALPEIALRNGARLVILNAEETPFDPVADAVVPRPARRGAARPRRPGLTPDAGIGPTRRWEYPTPEVGFTPVWPSFPRPL